MGFSLQFDTGAIELSEQAVEETWKARDNLSTTGMSERPVYEIMSGWANRKLVK